MNQQSNKILVVTNSITGGGAEDSAYKVYEELRLRGLNIRFCALNSAPNEIIPEEVVALSRQWKAGILATYRCFRDFAKLVKVEKPNILISHCELPELFSAFLKETEIHIICVEHTTEPWHKRKFLGMVVRLLLKFKHVSWVTVNSSSPQIWLGASNPLYIANPVDFFSSKSKQTLGTPIVFVGRLRKEKRPQWAIAAAVMSNLKINVYGEGPELNSLRKKYAKYDELVDFKGYKKDPWDAIGSDALVIVPSKFEGDGLVVVEAILRQQPILLFDTADLRRFNMPNINYFKNKKELFHKVSLGKMNRFEEYTPSIDMTLEFQEKRNIRRIVDQWEKLLSFESPAT